MSENAISQLDKIKAPSQSIPDEPDPLTSGHLKDMSVGEAEYQSRLRKSHADDREQEVRNRGVYTGRLFTLMVVWMSVVLSIVVVSGIKSPPNPPTPNHDWPWWAWWTVVVLLAGVVLGLWIPRRKKQRATNKAKAARRARLRYVVHFALAIGVVICTSLITVVSADSDLKDPSSSGWSFMEWVVSFELSEPVLLALIGGTTANVIGLFLVVAGYLFPRRSKDSA